LILLLLLNYLIWSHLLWLLEGVLRSRLIDSILKAVGGLLKTRTKLHLLLVAWRWQLRRRLLLECSGLPKSSIIHHLRLLLVSLVEIHRLLLLRVMLLLLHLLLLLLLLDQLILRVRWHSNCLTSLHCIYVLAKLLILLLMLLLLLLLRMSFSEGI